MGTSTSFKTPSGGGWTGAKRRLSGACSQPRGGDLPAAVGAAFRAAGGLTVSTTPGSSTRTSESGTSGGVRGGGSGGGWSSSRRRISRTAAGLGAFGATTGASGLAEGLASLGLGELVGRSAAEVVARVSERLTETAEGLVGEVARSALQQSLLAAAELGGTAEYADLEQGLQAFLADQGPIGLVELFLEHYSFEILWLQIEDHIRQNTDDIGAYELVMVAIKELCHAEVQQAMSDLGASAGFDWFGRAGQQLAQRVVDAVNQRVMQL